MIKDNVPIIIVTGRDSWEGSGFAEELEEHEEETVEQAFVDCGLEAYRLQESTYEVANFDDSAAVREALAASPLLEHSAAMESSLDWT